MEKELETLPFEEFCRLSDEEILSCDRERLEANVIPGCTEQNVKLHLVVSEYYRDSKRIKDLEFDKNYKRLRQDDDPLRVCSEYWELRNRFF